MILKIEFFLEIVKQNKFWKKNITRNKIKKKSQKLDTNKSEILYLIIILWI